MVVSVCPKANRFALPVHELQVWGPFPFVPAFGRVVRGWKQPLPAIVRPEPDDETGLPNREPVPQPAIAAS
jgi:hypothetical protein